ncbi:putative phage tail assembly chaperone [Microbulbifer sp. VAAF005]|uniref:putative phage tail assembly chaperone n=1 Tax=Microbulbifer sp. VAAF005 TaxID=3034230 RepID=UPI0024ADD7AF|nr:putative phage tail assembly chaperone [Microbulbifer sp. VAAF005]WHI46806.1 putative phage tail assembly chaperone [Microbulbifer sp. VAAF005]
MAKDVNKDTVDENTQGFEVTIDGSEVLFKVTRNDYNKLVNQLGPGNKVNAFHNFLVSTVSDEGKQALLKVLADRPGSEVAIGSGIYEAYTPDLQVTVKKR